MCIHEPLHNIADRRQVVVVECQAALRKAAQQRQSVLKEPLQQLPLLLLCPMRLLQVCDRFGKFS